VGATLRLDAGARNRELDSIPSLRTRVFTVLLQQEQRNVISQRIDPKIILANTLLQLTTMELVQSIENELLENPALEAVEEVGCDGNCIDPNACPYCSVRLAARRINDQDQDSIDSGDRDLEADEFFVADAGESGDDYDPVGNLEAETTLQQHLITLLHAAVSHEDFAIGEYIINSLDEKGWMGDTLDNIADELRAPVADVCRVLRIIQTFDPPGIAAQNLQECLLLQLRYMRDVDPASLQLIETAEQMVLLHFSHFCSRRYIKLARSLKIRPEEAKAAVDYVRARLNPFPASQFRSPWAYRPTNSKATVRPDIIVRRSEFGYEIDVAPDAYILSVNPQWRDLYIQMRMAGKGSSDEERKHIIEYVERAERFIRTIQQRRVTLRQITRCIIDCQSGFLETGSHQFLRPLTRTQIAHKLSLHESTVSRATANKFIQLPNQEVISFEVFFDSSLSAKDVIEAIIQEEDPENPLSDQEIVDALREKGITVARRTIVKYREDRKILSSNRRRR
jgi:RNA polymerase sigma-54 factor